MRHGGGVRVVEWCGLAAGLWLMAGAGAGLAQSLKAGPAPRERHVLFYEAEEVFTDRQQWQTQNWSNPSGGEWLYGNADRGTPTGTVKLPDSGLWAVWVRVWDWGQVDRRAQLEVNGDVSYVLGGSCTYQWVWYHTHLVEADQLDLKLIAFPELDAWVDCLAITNDLSWVPSHELVNGKAYVSDAPYERVAGRVAYIWCREERPQHALTAFRKAFTLQGDRVVHARVSVAALGRWTLWLNGEEVAAGGDTPQPQPVDLGPRLRPGPNALCVEAEVVPPLPGLWVEGGIETADGWALSLCSSPAWKCAARPAPNWRHPDFDDGGWDRPFARLGLEPHKRG